MQVAIMQPYLFPYMGYFQLLAAVDRFVLYDNIKYTKKGWINRNRILENGQAATFTLPVAAGSDALDVRDRQIASDFAADKLIARMSNAYRRAPFFRETLPLVEQVLTHPDRNLFGFLHHALVRTAEHVGIGTPVTVASTVDADHSLRSEERVLAICGALGASRYVNPIGGVDLYSREAFADRGIDLQFLRMLELEYPQTAPAFVPSLSIVDVLMHVDPETVQRLIRDHYRLEPGE